MGQREYTGHGIEAGRSLVMAEKVAQAWGGRGDDREIEGINERHAQRKAKVGPWW